ncbi:MAG: RNA polymerase factor sigma-54 [Bradymonadales bacterium]|nr:RNA polymerase factor sigma-54 [Bradymonadales bacterium]
MEIKQQLKLAQQLRMTPQLQQAIKLLQLSKLELVELVQKEMVENPVLEEATDDAGRTPAEVEDSLVKEADRLAAQTSSELSTTEMSENAAAERAISEIDWDAYLENYSSPMPSLSYRGMQEEMPGPEATLTRKEGLIDHLRWQLQLNASCEDERLVGEQIIGNLDANGYLVGLTIEEIAQRCDVSEDYAEGVLEFIQEFDPVGIAARDLKECLLVQARHYYSDDLLVQQVIDGHLVNLQKRNLKAIAKELSVTLDEIIRAARCIRSLDPQPGSSFESEEPRYIVPDIYVYKLGDDFICVPNEDGLPKLRISDYYRRTLSGGESREARAYIQDKLRSAWWLIRSIHQRQRTILRVTESIMRFQCDFLHKGVSQLKPLVLRDVAEDIGVHESTVSRVTTNKYVHTPQGIFELKYFFNSAIGCSDGTDTASESVKMRIKQIISGEDVRKPLSDQKIADMLAQEGIEIARRTVAKYREMMNILKSSQRKQLF